MHGGSTQVGRRTTMQDVEQIIRERAYHLWLESGCPEGSADIHWLAAQREVLDASLGQFGQVAKKSQAAKSKSARSPRKKKRAA
jgi:hypothetical protein